MSHRLLVLRLLELCNIHTTTHFNLFHVNLGWYSQSLH